MQRSMLLLENSIKSPHTRKTYLYHLKKFLEFYHIKDYDSLAGIEQEKMQIMVEDYAMYLKKAKSANSIIVVLAAIRAFLECNDIELRWKKIKRLMPAKIKKTGASAWSTEEIQTMLSFATDHRTKTLVYFLVSTGVRIGALETIKMKDIAEIEDCNSVLVYEGQNEEYVTFLTPEASMAFDSYIKKRETDGEKITSNSPVFRSSYQLGYGPVKSSSTSAIKELIRRLIIKSGLRNTQVKTGKRYNTQTDHGFRKRYNTILKTTPDMNISLAEKMMGHSVTVPLDNVYLPASDPRVIQQSFKEFKKAIPELTIDDSERKHAELDKLKQEKKNSQDQVQQIKELSSTVAMLSHKIDLINNTKEA